MADNVIRESGIDRRQLLSMIGASGVAGIAGCLGGGDDDGNGTADAEPPDGEPLDPEFTYMETDDWNPNDTDINIFGPTTNVPWWINIFWGQRWWEANLDTDIIGMLVEDWESVDNGQGLEITIDDDFTFWDGTEITGEDVLLSYYINNYQQFEQRHSPDTPAEIIQDDPVVIRYDEGCPTNEVIKTFVRQYEHVFIKYDDMAEWIDQYEDASDSAEFDEITTSLGDERFSLEDVVDNSWGAGLWKPVDWATDYCLHERYEDHPYYDRTNIEQLRLMPIADAQRARQEFDAGNVDIAMADTVGSTPDNPDMELYHEVVTDASIGLRFNWRNEHLSRRNFRRALAYIIDFEEVIDALEQGMELPQQQVEYQDMASPAIRDFMSDGFTDDYIDYGVNAREEEATALLEEEGYEHDGDVWRDEDGDSVSLEHLSPDWGAYVFMSEYLDGILGDFGIDLEITIPSWADHQQRWLETYEFDTAIWYHQGPYPAEWYGTHVEGGSTWAYLNDAIDWDNYDAEGECPDEEDIETPPVTQDTDPRTAMPIHLEYPTEVGQMDLDGETETLDPFINSDLLERPLSDDRIAELTEEFAWTANFHVPAITLYHEQFSWLGNTTNFRFPDMDENREWANVRDPWHQFVAGQVQANTQ